MTRALLVACVVAACGYPPLDANPDGQPAHGDGSGSGSSACQVPAAGYGHPTIGQQASQDIAATSMYPEQISYLGQLNNDAAPDYVEIDLYDTYAPFQNGLDAPATITLTDDSVNCGGCAFIQANCPNCFADNSVAGSWYIATSGTLSVTMLGTNMVGTLTNATFAHCTSPANAAATVIGDGCTTKIDSVSFNAPISN